MNIREVISLQCLSTTKLDIQCMNILTESGKTIFWLCVNPLWWLSIIVQDNALAQFHTKMFSPSFAEEVKFLCAHPLISVRALYVRPCRVLWRHYCSRSQSHFNMRLGQVWCGILKPPLHMQWECVWSRWDVLCSVKTFEMKHICRFMDSEYLLEFGLIFFVDLFRSDVLF